MHSGVVDVGGNTTRRVAVPTPGAGTDQEKEEAGGRRDSGALLEEAPATQRNPWVTGRFPPSRSLLDIESSSIRHSPPNVCFVCQGPGGPPTGKGYGLGNTLGA